MRQINLSLNMKLIVMLQQYDDVAEHLMGCPMPGPSITFRKLLMIGFQIIMKRLLFNIVSNG